MGEPAGHNAAQDETRVEVAIVGAGFGGLCMALKLLERGERNFVILEKDTEIGGTWRDNSYPGAECDVQSHLYSFSFAPKPDWTQRYAGWREIQQYILDVAQRHGVRPFVRFGQHVDAARFDAATGRWHLRSAQGMRIDARHVVLATGPLHVPYMPDMPGLEQFKGRIFHSARWDHSYDFTGKRIASIGTGGSAIQYCPKVAPGVAQLDVYQRSPAWVIPRDSRFYSADARRRFAEHPWLRRLHRARLYWTNESRVWPAFHPALARGLQRLARLNIQRQVRDPRLARQLTPDYTIGCKRVLISNEWYPMFNRSNVALITQGIREVGEREIVTTDGVSHAADCIILGTGFVVDPRIYMQGFPVTGLDGRELTQAWRDGAEAYKGVSVHGFPNLHQLVGPNTALGHNSLIFMIEAQVHYVLRCMDRLQARRADYLDVKADVQARFNRSVQRALQGTVWSTGCRSWYQQADGKNFTIWPWSTWRYWLTTRAVQPHDYRFGTALVREVASGHCDSVASHA